MTPRLHYANNAQPACARRRMSQLNGFAVRKSFGRQHTVNMHEGRDARRLRREAAALAPLSAASAP